MINITSVLNSLYFAPRMRAIERYATEAEALQMQVMKQLTGMAQHTEWGKLHHYASIKS